MKMANRNVNTTTISVSCLKNQDPLGGHKIGEVIAISITTIIWSIITSGGNLLVIISFIINKKLRIVTNYFIISLATADVLIGIVTINLYSTYRIINCWPLGDIICDIWLVMDYGGCQASVISLVLVCMDRYFILTRPMSYSKWRTKKMAKVAIILSWILAMLIWVPLIYVYPLTTNKKQGQGECIPLFLEGNPTATLVTHVVGYFLPVIIIGIQYIRLYSATRRRERPLIQSLGNRLVSKDVSARIHGRDTKPKESTTLKAISYNTTNSDGSVSKAKYDIANSYHDAHSESFNESRTDMDAIKQGENDVIEHEEVLPKKKGIYFIKSRKPRGMPFKRYRSTRSPKDKHGLLQEEVEMKDIKARVQLNTVILKGEKIDTSGKEKKFSSSAKHKRIARMIFLVVITYVIFWLPYQIFAVIRSFCKTCIPDALWKFSYGFAYVNSTANPFCYTLANRQFRKSFKKILCWIIGKRS